MSYTRVWSDTTPADSDQASTLGQAIRNLRVDVEERMNTLTNGGWDTDPVGGGAQTFKLNIPPTAAAFRDDLWVAVYTTGIGTVRQALLADYTAGGAAVAGDLYVPIVLPQGVTITGMRMAGRIVGSSAVMLVQGIYVANTTSAMDTAPSIGNSASPTNGAGWTMMTTTLAPHTIIDGDMITAVIRGFSSTGSAYFGGLEITYTRPLPYLVY